jgi:ubiquinone/menaquinone biosynthesis C-methylase UbiE
MSHESRFDKEAAQWDANPVRRNLAQAVGAAIRKATQIQPGWRILDFGAGTGLVTLQLQPGAAQVIAVDQSAGMLQQLQEKIASAGIHNVQTRQWNVDASAFPEDGFDLVASSMTLHHLRDVPTALGRFARILKPGGWIAVADLDTEDGSFHGPSPDVFHHGFDRATLRQWLTEAGFVDVTIQDAHQVEKPDAQGHIHIYPIFMAVGRRG